MILADSAIQQAMNEGKIAITPFDEKCLGSNSYDVHLSEHIATYDISYFENKEIFPGMDSGPMKAVRFDRTLDAKKDNPITRYAMPKEGFTFLPGTVYLASTVEYTETFGFVPFLEGKSSVGRLGVNVHITAGKGDIGFCGHWTMEITVVHPVILYPGMPIAQLIYFKYEGICGNPYYTKKSAKYSAQSHLPQSSAMWKNFL